jgi:hypothetical protein
MTTAALRVFQGPWGSVHELPTDLPPREGMPEQSATIAIWFLHAPAAHPLWPHYLLSCVHLRDVEGQSQPPHRSFPDASHELMLLALNPELAPWNAETVVETMLAPREVSAFLTPPNMVQQLRAATDAQAAELTRLVARALVDGILAIEPDDRVGSRAVWRAVIEQTLEHLRLGTHPSHN